MRVALATLAIGVMFVLAIAGSYTLALHALDNANRQWCPVLELLTTRPVSRPAADAGKNARQAYAFYTVVLGLEHGFGCAT